jgi:hypothetical protein
MIFQFFTSINISIIISILILFYLSEFGAKISFVTILKINSLLFLFFIIKIGATYGVASVFEIQEVAKKYYYGYCSSLFMIATLLYPVILLMSYLNKGSYLDNCGIYLFYIGVLIHCLLKIILLKRLNAFKIQFLFYIILYLCTVEVLPYLVLWKTLKTLI